MDDGRSPRLAKGGGQSRAAGSASAAKTSQVQHKGQLEQQLLQRYEVIAGVDEVGRGCIAGPVYGGCVVLDYSKLAALSDTDKALLRDSKTLSAKQRGEAIAIIAEVSVAAEVGHASVREIEQLGIVPGTFLAMARAFKAVYDPDVAGTIILVDGKQVLSADLLPRVPAKALAQMSVVKGDSSCFAIAAASIIAKQARDGYMVKVSDQYPGYGFDQHVGYGTKAHRDALISQGYCELHRRNFAPIRQMVEEGL